MTIVVGIVGVIFQLVVFKTMELYPFVEDGVDAGASDAEVGWPLASPFRSVRMNNQSHVGNCNV